MPPVIAPPAPVPHPPQRGESYQLAVPDSAVAAKIVRDFVGTLLRTGTHPGLADDARLCVSELVSNLYCHTSSELVRVEVMVGRDRRLGHVRGRRPRRRVRRTGDGVNGANHHVPDASGAGRGGPGPGGAGRPPPPYRKRPAKHVFPQVKHAATAFHPRG